MPPLIGDALHKLRVGPIEAEVIDINTRALDERQRMIRIDAPEDGVIIAPVVEDARIIFDRPRDKPVDLPIAELRQQPHRIERPANVGRFAH